MNSVERNGIRPLKVSTKYEIIVKQGSKVIPDSCIQQKISYLRKWLNCCNIVVIRHVHCYSTEATGIWWFLFTLNTRIMFQHLFLSIQNACIPNKTLTMRDTSHQDYTSKRSVLRHSVQINLLTLCSLLFVTLLHGQFNEAFLHCFAAASSQHASLHGPPRQSDHPPTVSGSRLQAGWRLT